MQLEVSLLTIIFLIAGPLATMPVAGVDFGQNGLLLAARTDKLFYDLAEPVNITVLLTNEAATNATIQFTYSCRFGFTVGDRYGLVWYSRNKHFACFEGSPLVMGAGQTLVFSFTWDQKDDSGKQVPVPREFIVNGQLNGASADVPLRTEPANIRIGGEILSLAPVGISSVLTGLAVSAVVFLGVRRPKVSKQATHFTRYLLSLVGGGLIIINSAIFHVYGLLVKDAYNALEPASSEMTPIGPAGVTAGVLIVISAVLFWVFQKKDILMERSSDRAFHHQCFRIRLLL